jgi:hypothetical protein
LKRQQAAEDAIALSMAKVTSGQKMSRLPPGKIFGMTVTDPDFSNKSKLNSANDTCTSSIYEEEMKNLQIDRSDADRNPSNISKLSTKPVRVIISYSDIYRSIRI